MKEKWIAHNTSEMPRRLKPDTLVNVAYVAVHNNGELFNYWHPAIAWMVDWWVDGAIIAYQIVEERK